MNEKSQIKERMLQYANTQRIKKTDFFQKIQCRPSNFSIPAIFSAPNTVTVTNFLTEYSEVSPDWLLLGKGDMLRNNQNYDTPAEIASLEAKVMKTEKDRQCRELTECERKLREREEYIICLHEKISKMQQELIERQQEMLNHFSALLSKK